MDKMGKKINMFEGQGCDEEIVNLSELHIPLYLSSKRERDERSTTD